MNKQLFKYLQFSLQCLDLLVLNAIIIISKFLLVHNLPSSFEKVYYRYLIFLNVSWVLLSWITRVYTIKSISSFEKFSRKTKNLYISWLSVIMIYVFFFRLFDLSRLFIIVSLIACSIGLLCTRFAYILLRNSFYKREDFKKRILILGYNETAKKLANRLETSENNRIIGFVEEPENITELSSYPIVGSMTDTMLLSHNLHINQIFCTISPEQDTSIYQLMQQAEDKFIRFRIIPDLAYFINKPVHVELYWDMPMFAMRREPLEDIGNQIKKRIADVVISSFAIIFILSWLIPLLGLLIWLESRGPVFFVQLRSGRNNKAFRCLKFRSMKVNKDSDLKQASRGDERLTRIGKFIRKTSLDEFPQFINVLRGEMSVVGPRPHMLKHTEDYSRIVRTYKLRQYLKPGITGWAQINGYRGEINGNEEIEGRVAYDIWYSEAWTLWFDLRIIFLTAYNVLRGEKNAF